ncbi:MAG: ankyrin repeat domain-containing protein [Gemmatimonas sp.]
MPPAPVTARWCRRCSTAGADPQTLTTTGVTALHLAAQAGDVASVSALVAKKADVNAREKTSGQTPLMFAASADRPAVVTALVKAGANTSVRTNTVNLTEELARQQAAARKRNEVLFSFLPEKVRDSALKAISKQEADQEALRRQFGLGVEPVPAADTSKSAAPRAAAAVAAAPGAAPAPAPAKTDSVKKPRIGLIAPPVSALTPSQVEQAILAGREMYNKKDVDKTTETVVPRDTTNGFNANYEASVGNMGGLTALHHAVRQGNIASALALVDGGANINEVSASDSTTPLLQATDQRTLRSGHGTGEAWRRCEVGQHSWAHAAVCGDQYLLASAVALSAAAGGAVAEDNALRADERAHQVGRRRQRAHEEEHLVLRLQQLRQRELRPRAARWHDAVLACDVRGGPRSDEVAQGGRRRRYHAVVPSAAAWTPPPAHAGRGSRLQARCVARFRIEGGAGRCRHLSHSRGRGCGLRQWLRGQRAPSCARRLDARHEVSGGRAAPRRE